MARGRREYTPDERLFQQVLGETVRRLRIQLGLSQDDFSVRARLERSYIPALEAGKFDVRISTLTRIAETLGVDADQLLRQVVQDVHRRTADDDCSAPV